MDDRKKFAVLIDADNVSPERFERIFGEISLYGTATYRRIYGNWAEYNRSMLKEKLVEFALTPVQQFNYIKGKNATDIAMVIEAMDILYTGEVDGFAIVTNDSDFTRLALRLRESGMIVIGMGDDVAPASFRAACTDFIVLRESRRIAEERTEQRKLRLSARKPSLRTKADIDGASMKKAAEHIVLKAEEDIDETELETFETESETPAVNEAPAATDKVLSDRELRNAIRDFLFECEEDDGWFSASTMVNKLKEKFPSLDIKDYADLPLFAGKRKIWTTYFLALGFCENRQKGPSNYLLRLKPEERRKLAAERGTDSSKAEIASPQKAAEKADAEKAADIPAVIPAPAAPAASGNSNGSTPAKRPASSRRGRSRGKAVSKTDTAVVKVTEAAAGTPAEKKQEVKAEAPAGSKQTAKAEVPAGNKQAAKAEAPFENKQTAKTEAPVEKKAETKPGRRGRKPAAKAKVETADDPAKKAETKKAAKAPETPAAVQPEAPKKAASPRRGRPRKKTAETGSENA